MAIKKVNFIHQGNVLIPDTAGGIRFPDTRDTDPVATEYTGQQIHYDFKLNSTIGITGVGSFSVLQTVRPWGDYSGGATVQVAYTGNNFNKMPYIFVRSNNATNATTDGEAFGNWYQIYHSGNFNASSITSDIAGIKNGTIPAGKATQLATGRTISLTTGATGVSEAFDGSKNISIQVTEISSTYLSWGGQARTSATGIDAALTEDIGGNLFSGIPNSAFKFEHSQDNGSTWTDVTAQFSGQGNGLVTTSGYFTNGNTLGDQSTSRQHRITITCPSGLYCTVQKIGLYISTNGATNCKCKIEIAYPNSETWSLVTEASIEGWSGWNFIPASFVFNSNNPAQRNRIRFTFSITGVSTVSASELMILKIRAYGNIWWDALNNLARSKHVYTYDNDLNVEFPNDVTASGFHGTFYGNATSATTASSVAWANVTGKPNVATLGSDGKVPASQLPAYVDDVLEYANKNSFPATGETGKIYVDKSTNLTWRWSGTTYVQISPSLALGHTSSTAFPGDEGLQLDEYVDTLIKYSNTMYYSENASEAALKTAAENADIHNQGWKVLLRNTSVMRAYQDIDGNIIGSTYAKKTEIPNPVVIDSVLSSTSINPVQNRIVNTAVTNLQTNIDTLKTDLQSGNLIPYKAEKANADASGQGIIETYAKKTEVTTLKTQLTNGTIVVMSATSANKATNDSAGNNIVSTYAKKSDIPSGLTVDSALSSTSTNPVQNKVIYAQLNTIGPKADDAYNLAYAIQSGSVAAYKATCDGNGDVISSTYLKSTALSNYAMKSQVYKEIYSATATVFGASNRVRILQYGTSGTKILICSGLTASISDGSATSWSIPTTITSHGFSGSNLGVVAMQSSTGGLDQYRNGVAISSSYSSSISIRNNTNTTTAFRFIIIGIVA